MGQSARFNFIQESKLKYWIRVEGVESVYPSVNQIHLKNKSKNRDLEIALIALNEKKESKKLKYFKPFPKDKIKEYYPEITQDGDIPDLGRYLGYAKFSPSSDSTTIIINNLSVFNNGCWIAIIGSDSILNIQAYIEFKRMGIHEFPKVTIESSGFENHEKN
jgi:hypothetical protein